MNDPLRRPDPDKLLERIRTETLKSFAGGQG